MEILFKAESYKIIGCAMEVHSTLGKGFSEVVYKDALAYELRAELIPFVREQEYDIRYKDILLPHKYFADFVVFDSIILEIKAVELLAHSHTKQCLNYLAASQFHLALLINFGKESLDYRRVVFSRETGSTALWQST